jgi:hypothetical protein
MTEAVAITANAANANAATTANDTAHPGRRTATVRRAPRRDPPFDDELPRPRLHLVRGREQVLPFPLAEPSAPPARRPDLPDPIGWTRRLLLGLTETAAGRRPLNQVATLLSPAVSRGVGADFERVASAGQVHWLHRARVRTIRLDEPADGVAELAVTVQDGARVRALALRLEARHGRWRCTRLQIG